MPRRAHRRPRGARRSEWRSATLETRPRLSESGIDQRQGHVDHRLEVGDRDPLVGRVDVGHAVREVDDLEPAVVEDVRVGRAARELVVHLVAAPFECVGREHDRAVAAAEAVAG